MLPLVVPLRSLSIAAALVIATVVVICAAGPLRAQSMATLTLQNPPITAADVEKSGAQPPPPYDLSALKHDDPGMPTSEPLDPQATSRPTPTTTSLAPSQLKMDQTRTDRVRTPGQVLFDKARDMAFLDPLSWSVTIFKKRQELIVYYQGRLFKTYHAVFGRSLEPGTKLWEGDRRTPEGIYTIVERHPSHRWDWFLTLNYPNETDRRRYQELREGGEVPIEDGHPVGVGSRIGIHGTDEPRLNRDNVNWTTGCISVDDQDIEELKKLLPDGTLVIIKP